jgi:PKD repeat protein
MPSLCSIGAICAFILVSLGAAGQLTIVPTTTLKAETSNNTSASTTFSGQTNGNAGPGNVSKSSIRNLLYPGSTTKIYAAVMPWFGRPDHMSVGYTSSDPAQITAQINDMLSRGIQGAVIPWYGPNTNINSETAINFMQAAQSSGNFEFSIMIDVGAVAPYAQQNGCDVTTQLITDLNYIASTFYGSTAYTKVSGRPLIYFFGVEAYYIDWNRVRSNIAGNPMFMIRNVNAFSDANADGAYSWVNIDHSNPNDMMLSYLDGFYTAAQSSAQYTAGSGYKGFNDTLAAWSSNRILNQQCGLTWLDTFSEANKYYSSSHQLAAIQVVTWNDYEEGTEIESGIGNCVALAPTITGSTLNWSIGPKASESTINDYSVFISTDGQNLMKLADVAAGTHSLNLSQYNLAPGVYVLYVKAVGKASIVNHMSPAVAFNPSDEAPIASLSLSPTSGPAPLTVTASSAASSDPDGSITTVKLDFGDGTVLSGGAGFATSHTYQASGTYTVTLTVTDNSGLFSTTQQTVSVAAGPGVTITSPKPGANVNSPVHVAATALIIGGVSYMEVLLDGATTPVYLTAGSTVDTFLHFAAGTHTLRVVAHDANTPANYIYSDVTITVGTNDAPPSAVLTANPFGGGNQVMACTATSTDSVGFIVGSLVDFGDGATAAGPTAFHTYASPGVYKVTATVTDNAGLTSTASSTVTVGATTTTTTTSLASSANPIMAGASVTFTATVTTSGSATGTITFMDGSSTLGTSTLNTLGGLGVATYTTSSLPLGQQSITAVYAGDTTHTGSTSAVLTQTVNAADFTLSSSPSSAKVTAGNSQTFTLSVMPQGSFTTSISFSCTGLPALATCGFSPATVTPNSSTTTTRMTVTTAAHTASLAAPAFGQRSGPLYAMWLALPTMLLTMVGLAGPKFRKLLNYTVVCLLAGGCLFLAACGGGASGSGGGGTGGTPPGAYSITITAAAGSDQHSTTVTLNVQ